MYMVSEDSGKSNQNVHLDIFYTASSRFNRASVQRPVVQSIVSLKTWKFVISKLCNPYLV